MFGRVVVTTLLLTAKLCAISGLLLETVVYQQYTLRPEYIDAVMTGATRTCECRSRCAELGCRTYSVTELELDMLLCQFSLSPAPLGELQMQLPGTKSHVVHKSDYKHVGDNYYRIRTDNKLDRFEARQQCLDEGGQLAVASTPELLAELEQAMIAAGVRATWVGLFRDYLVPGDYTQFTTLSWELNNGTFIEQADALIRDAENRCFHIDLDASVVDRINNRLGCPRTLPPACQRNF